MDSPLGGAVVALLVGLLLGLEREKAEGGAAELFAGIRTFPLIALCGYLGAVAGQNGIPFAFPAALLALGALVVASYARPGREPGGATTEVAAVLTCLLGGLVAWGGAQLAAPLAVMVALLLTLKAPLHHIAGAVSQREVLAILKFGVVSVILVPILPTRALSYLGGLAPRTLGLLVVLLSAVSLGGYLLVRIYGRRRGWALAGLLGGLVSSTAVTLSMSGKARAVPGLTRALGVGVLLASSILYLRSLVVIGILDRTLAYHLAPRLAGLLAIGLAFAGLHFRAQATTDTPDEVSLGNPAELGRAFGLALMFAAVMLASRLAQARLGTLGLFSVGLVGGLVDVDSVAVASARLHQQGLADLGSASGTFLLATLSNLFFKGGVVLVVGGPQLSRIVLPAFGVIAVATGLALGW